MKHTLFSCKKCDSFNLNNSFHVNSKINKTENSKNTKSCTIENYTTVANSTNAFVSLKTIDNNKNDELIIIEYPYKNFDSCYKKNESNSSSIIENESVEGIKLNRIINNKNLKGMKKNCQKKIYRFLNTSKNKTSNENNIRKKEIASAIKETKIITYSNKSNYKSQSINKTNKHKKKLPTSIKRNNFKIGDIGPMLTNISLNHNQNNLNKFKSLDITKEKSFNKKSHYKTLNFNINVENKKNKKNEKLNKLSSITDNNMKKKVYIPFFTKTENPFAKINKSNKKY